MEDGHQDRLFLYFYAILLRYTPVFSYFCSSREPALEEIVDQDELDDEAFLNGQ